MDNNISIDKNNIYILGNGENVTYQEIAKRLGVSLAKARQQYISWSGEAGHDKDDRELNTVREFFAYMVTVKEKEIRDMARGVEVLRQSIYAPTFSDSFKLEDDDTVIVDKSEIDSIIRMK